MKFSPTPIAGCVIVEPTRVEDARGFFARTYSADDFAERGIPLPIVQSSISYNHKLGTLRGLHFQLPPYQEAKLVSCIQGRIYDVAVDVRPWSPTYGQWFGTELSPDSGGSLYLGEGLAHGFLTLSPETTVSYNISAPYSPEAARGILWNDPRLRIDWPDVGELTLSARDQSWPPWPS